MCIHVELPSGHRLPKSESSHKKRFPWRLADGDVELVKLSLRNNPVRLEEFFALYNKNRQHLLPWHNEQEVLLFKNIAAMKAHIRKQKLSWHAVYYAGTMVGLIELRDRDEYINISYWVDEDYTRKGIAHAALAMMDRALSAMRCNCLQAKILADNEPSTNLMKKLNYTLHAAEFYVRESGESDHMVVFQKILRNRRRHKSNAPQRVSGKKFHMPHSGITN